MNVTNPLSGVHEPLFVAMADPVEEKLFHMVTADPARTPSFTPFAAGDYFLSASSTTPCDDDNDRLELRLPAQHGSTEPDVRLEPRRDTTGDQIDMAGSVGPGSRKNAKLSSDFCSDHTDVRPTMLALTGLKDSYVSDGRVLTELVKNSALPQSLKTGTRMQELGQAYKQINASFGQFSLNTLAASTRALASSSSGDSTYTDIENQLAALGADRDALASQIRAGLWNAEFDGQQISQQQAKAWIDQANAILGCGGGPLRAVAELPRRARARATRRARALRASGPRSGCGAGASRGGRRRRASASPGACGPRGA